MKRILILGRKNVGEKNDAQSLAAAIAGQSADLHVTGLYLEDVVIDVRQNEVKIFLHGGTQTEEITQYDKVILINWSHNRLYTDLAHSIAYAASKGGIEVWNKELVSARSSTKLSQLVRLSYESVNIPHTLFSLTQDLLQPYSDSLNVPFVAKDPLASRGRSNYLCQDWDDLLSNSDDSTSYLLQEYIPNDKSDLRMFVAGGKTELIIRRHGSGESHLNNVSQGGTAEIVAMTDIPASLLDQTNAIAKHFERELCGIDFMLHETTGEYVFLEINTTPQIVNGVYVNEKAAALARALER